MHRIHHYEGTLTTRDAGACCPTIVTSNAALSSAFRSSESGISHMTCTDLLSTSTTTDPTPSIYAERKHSQRENKGKGDGLYGTNTHVQDAMKSSEVSGTRGAKVLEKKTPIQATLLLFENGKERETSLSHHPQRRKDVPCLEDGRCAPHRCRRTY